MKDMRIEAFSGTMYRCRCVVCDKWLGEDDPMYTVYFEESRHVEWMDFHAECFERFAKLIQITLGGKTNGKSN